MDQTYKKAMEHLKFSEDLWKKVQEKADNPPHRRISLYTALCAAALCAVCFVTAFAASDSFRSSVLTVLHMDNAVLTMEPAGEMSFAEAEIMEGVSIHYMPLDGAYSFRDGMIFGVSGGNYRKDRSMSGDTMTQLYEITPDYRVVPTGEQKTLNELFTEKEDALSRYRKYRKPYEALELADKQLIYTGLVVGRNENGEFTIADLAGGSTLTIPDLPDAENACVQRYDERGQIALSWFSSGNVTQIGIVDADHGELKLLAWDQRYKAESWGWLDENRYAVMCLDGDAEDEPAESDKPLPQHYLCIYEF